MPLWLGGPPSAATPGLAPGLTPSLTVATRVFLLLGTLSEDAIADSLNQSYGAWIEVGPLNDDQLLASLKLAVAADLFVAFTTHTASTLHLAGRIVSAVDHHHPMPQVQREDMELALHEAITNAVVHGNLQIDGMKGLTVSALDRFAADLSARMADPTFANRRIEVWVKMEPSGAVIDVIDQGSGFAGKPRHAEAAGASPAGASGRGLDMIGAIVSSLELLDQGRRIRMRFSL